MFNIWFYIKAIFIFCLIIISVCLYRTLFLFKLPDQPEMCSENSTHNAIKYDSKIINRFQQALKIATITSNVNIYETKSLIELRNFIQKNFPAIHSSDLVNLEIIANYSLLYKIKGSNSKLKPYMLISHLDVVPVYYDKWEFDPFEAKIVDGYIYARGAVDNKSDLMSILEALEHLLKSGFKPCRTIYLAFGHDEEAHGINGAINIVKHLQAKNVKLEYILDEGTPITPVKGILNVGNLALISVTEKGYLVLELEANSKPGHSSMPEYETPIVKLSKALSKFNSRSQKNRFGYGIEARILTSIAPYAPFPLKFVLSNLWLFEPIVSYLLNFDQLGNALIRTSTSVNIIEGGSKFNIFPSTAKAVIDHRIHSSQSIKEIFEFDKKLINNKEISLKVLFSSEPCPISPHSEDDFGYNVIKESIREVFEDVIVSPMVMLASTDSKWFLNFTNNIYRFTPFINKNNDALRIHGNNERISVDNYIKMINFYHHLFLLSDKKELQEKSFYFKAEL